MTGRAAVRGGKAEMRSTSLFFLAVALAPTPGLLAAEITPGQQYFGPEKLTLRSLGLSFTLPAGCSGGVPDGQEVFLIGKDGLEGFVFVSADEATAQEALALMSAPVPLDNGITLVPAGKPTQKGSRITGKYSVTGVQMSAVATAVVGKHGVSVFVVSIAQAARLPAAIAIGKEVLSSVQLAKRAEPKPEAPAKGGSAFDSMLRGQHLVRMVSMSGYSEKITMELCADGRFFRNFNASSVSQLGTGGRQQGGSGRWSLSGNVLGYTLDGDSYQLTISTGAYADGSSKLFLDGKQWFRDGAARCP